MPGDVVPAAVAVDEVVVGGVVEDGAEPVTEDVEGVAVTHRNGARVELNDYTQEWVGDSGSLPESGLAVKLSRPDSGDSAQEPVEGAECLVRCTRFVEDKSAEKA